MKHSILYVLIFLSFFYGEAYCQDNSFDNRLNSLTNELATNLSKYKDMKIGVLTFIDLDGNKPKIGKYIAEQISVVLSQKFHIVNRNQLNAIIEENKLKTEGFINQATAKELKKLADVDILITGTITVFSDHIKVTIQPLDADANIVGQSNSASIPRNSDVNDLLGVTSPANGVNQGFNRPLNSNEQYNNPETVNKECEIKKTGDYCFVNKTSKKLDVEIITKDNQELWLSVSSGQTQCFYEVIEGVASYRIRELIIDGIISHSNEYENGQISVEKCKSKTFEIK
jgi:TolB-like protein